MKTKIINSLLVVALILGVTSVSAQRADMQYYRKNDKNGINVFETSKDNDVPFDGMKVRVGGDFNLQFQGLTQTNSGDSLAELSNNFNLPSANLNMDVQLYDGLRLHMRTYLSSRHHTEAYVKGGYLQIDKLDFIQPGFLSGVMQYTTIKVGMDDINYGDAHFRRSDNANTIFNPFVGNYIMDAFTTEPFAEVTVQHSGFLGVIGMTNGRLNQSPTPGDDGFVLYGKLGYDNQLSDDLRLRLTGSVYSSNDKGTRDYLYAGDRSGANYFKVLDGGDFAGRFNPGYAYQTAVQINPFVKYKGVEFFGVLEFINNGDSDAGGGFTQVGAEALYRFGGTEQFYVGGRYNQITGKQTDASQDIDINRFNVGGGWFLTENVMTKLEYVNQAYDGKAYEGTLYQGAEFKGIMLEATIAF
ncbi:hypothetical protein N6H18_01215 [Reichenbachiella agarivorans]|uniref:Phosphate-selective porin O and P n=1 Tax=Reichenbachiella agarivorans TaxID=2979464 RepID=A0ABY6CRC6_9BACT|nr:hypothetical protein [Reichenbachiella agarivorans]UXP32590.1 hypothetical protein N6H18_01215 [Reichenbachiella agarivorans]